MFSNHFGLQGWFCITATLLSINTPIRWSSPYLPQCWHILLRYTTLYYPKTNHLYCQWQQPTLVILLWSRQRWQLITEFAEIILRGVCHVYSKQIWRWRESATYVHGKVTHNCTTQAPGCDTTIAAPQRNVFYSPRKKGWTRWTKWHYQLQTAQHHGCQLECGSIQIHPARCDSLKM